MKAIIVHTPFNWKRPLTIVSWLIRKFTKTYYNHAAFIVTIDHNEFVLEADMKGVILIPLKDWVKEQVVTVYKMPKYYRAKAMSKVGNTKYDFASLLFYGLINTLTGKYYGYTDDRKAAERFYCYEYLAWVLGIPKWYSMLPNPFKKWADENLKLEFEKISAKDLLEK